MGLLSTKARKRLPKSAFAVASKRAYPIPDASHARDALSPVSAYGTPKEKAQVRSAVARKFPGIKQSKR